VVVMEVRPHVVVTRDGCCPRARPPQMLPRRSACRRHSQTACESGFGPAAILTPPSTLQVLPAVVSALVLAAAQTSLPPVVSDLDRSTEKTICLPLPQAQEFVAMHGIA